MRHLRWTNRQRGYTNRLIQDPSVNSRTKIYRGTDRFATAPVRLAVSLPLRPASFNYSPTYFSLGILNCYPFPLLRVLSSRLSLSPLPLFLKLIVVCRQAGPRLYGRHRGVDGVVVSSHRETEQLVKPFSG